jgi:hypothetical protein
MFYLTNTVKKSPKSKKLALACRDGYLCLG